MTLRKNMETTPDPIRKASEKVVSGNGKSTNGKSSNGKANSVVAAVDSGWAMIEFKPDGTIISANDNFMEVMGYGKKDKIEGLHHQIFCDETLANSKEYKTFWEELSKGVEKAGEFKRVQKDGKEVWLNATYAPVTDSKGNVSKVIKIAADITKMVNGRLNGENMKAAIDIGWASIEFEPDGTILSANENFVKTLGYENSDEIVGKHHRIFCNEEYSQSAEYKRFWEDLAKGKIHSGEFMRFTKKGEEIWINASYNPVKDEQGNVIRIIKIATDITSMVAARMVGEHMQEAINTGWASIEFKPDGTILSANKNFLNALGYDNKDEVVGKHHKIFCEQAYAASSEYKRFWENLAEGKIHSGEFKRVTKEGQEVWINASYTPVKDKAGKVTKVIKIAADITDMVASRAVGEHMSAAVNTGWASIEFEPDGTILTANKNFLQAVEYENEEEIVGKHHRIFCEKGYAESTEYKRFWENLANGGVQAGEFKRLSKNGNEVWINASYTPVTDSEGRVVKVIKIATDITDMVASRLKGENLQAAVDTGWALIEFEPDGTIVTANDNFLQAMGYSNQAEISGQHHRIFCDASHAASPEYSKFWKDLANGVVQNGEYLRVRKDGQQVWLQAAYTPLKDDNGNVNKVIKIAADISPVKFPVLAVNEIINDVSKGNLTRKFDMTAEGYVKEMGDALNVAIDNLNSLLSAINVSAQQVSQSADSMMERSTGMKNNTNEVASAISQMSKGAQDQAAKTDESSNLAEAVMKSATDMEEKANIINKAAENGKKSSESGLKIIKNLVENMEGISSSANLTADSIKILTERADEIGRTLNVITDIAAQTNLLALNAAIEAARAGEAGRGFAVVAEEIRKLAEESRKSAVDIEKIIGDVQKDTQAASKAIETMEGSVKQGNSASTEAESIFVEIANSSDETFNHSKEIQEATGTQKASIDTVVKNIEQIVVVAEETAAGTQQVASSSQELNNGMEDIASASTQLSEIAAELQSGVSQFKLSE
ncbi:PAS domain-containing protein [Fulvivirgaceae bacterium BMA10]|uniref:PAS domain-containing protein n=1 Tax=Splendidivirga corallicola TaxID=3051826 RepID=A0ABT8KUG7_9BACT|nr:PAS domain-containing protein [Fulvivirgaceae bacterium BMA10]